MRLATRVCAPCIIASDGETTMEECSDVNDGGDMEDEEAAAAYTT